MHFTLVDRVLERHDDRVVTIKQVSLAEEYLQDHFATFPVLPGVMMLEAMVQAARVLLAGRSSERLVLGSVRALKYGRFVKPGDVLRVEVTLGKALEGGAFDVRGEGRLLAAGRSDADEPPVAVSGRLMLRPVRVAGFGSSRP